MIFPPLSVILLPFSQMTIPITSRSRSSLSSAWVWAGKWDLSINPNKCACLIVGNLPPLSPSFSTADTNHRIPQVTDVRDLGVLLHTTFIASAHCRGAANTTRRLLFLARRSFCELSKIVFTPLYCALVLPYLDLLTRAINKGLPIIFAHWLREFFSNRKAKLQINSDRGRQLHQGLPQGSEKVEVAMFADDVSLFSSHPNKEVAEASIQEAIMNVAEWSRDRKLTLNTIKCEVAFYTNNSKEARWQPSVQLDVTTLNTTPLPKFLGVTTDRALSFGPHVAAVVSEASNRCRVLASLTTKRWGWRKDQLLKVYRVLHLGVINYAALAWQPWLAPTRTS